MQKYPVTGNRVFQSEVAVEDLEAPCRERARKVFGCVVEGSVCGCHVEVAVEEAFSNLTSRISWDVSEEAARELRRSW